MVVARSAEGEALLVLLVETRRECTGVLPRVARAFLCKDGAGDGGWAPVEVEVILAIGSCRELFGEGDNAPFWVLVVTEKFCVAVVPLSVASVLTASSSMMATWEGRRCRGGIPSRSEAAGGDMELPTAFAKLYNEESDPLLDSRVAAGSTTRSAPLVVESFGTAAMDCEGESELSVVVSGIDRVACELDRRAGGGMDKRAGSMSSLLTSCSAYRVFLLVALEDAAADKMCVELRERTDSFDTVRESESVVFEDIARRYLCQKETKREEEIAINAEPPGDEIPGFYKRDMALLSVRESHHRDLPIRS